MKKIFYTLMLFIVALFTAKAQTTIVNKLEIKSVATDTTATDVLVRGADRKVKKVPISFLQSIPQLKTVAGESLFGNGDIELPSPSLQQVLNVNSYASNKIIGLNFGDYSTGNHESLYVGSPYGFYNQRGTYGNSNYRLSELSTAKGLVIKSTSLGNGFMQLKADNLVNNNVLLQAPKLSGILPISVNGNYADQDGNITIPLGGSAPTLQQVLNNDPYAYEKTIGLYYSAANSGNDETLYVGAPYGFHYTRGNYGDPGYRLSELSTEKGLVIKSTSLGNAFMQLKADNLVDDDVYLQAPKLSGTIPISVNGNYADQNGNITVNSIASSGSYSPTFEVISNLSNVTGGATPSYYTRVGNVVTVYIRFFNNQSAANTATAFRASLPFPRATTNQINYVGTGTVGYGGTESDIPCRVFFEPGQTSCRISYYTKANFGTQLGVVSFQYSVDE